MIGDKGEYTMGKIQIALFLQACLCKQITFAFNITASINSYILIIFNILNNLVILSVFVNQSHEKD